MAGNLALEFRLELYVEGGLPQGLADRISAVLSSRWPSTWDVKVPAQVNFHNPAEWRAVVPLLDGTTAETLHVQLAKDILAMDLSHSFHFRTRWAFQETPNHQEVYEERWTPDGR